MSKLTLKEAGRYSNFLRDKINQVMGIVYCNEIESKMIEVKEFHKKEESYKDALNEEIIVEFDDKVNVEIDELNEIIISLVEEKAELAEAIANAKKKLKVKTGDEVRSLDSSIEYAKLLRRMSSEYYRHFIEKREGKRKSKGQAYGVNVEGNQTPYYYDIETITSLKYDKDAFIEKNKLVKKKADNLSEAIERAMTERAIEFSPKFNYLDSLDDVISKFKNI